MDQTKEEFLVWIRQAIADRKSPAYGELYSFLVACFVRADKNKTGKVSPTQFDQLVEEAAVIPRKYGFAPKTADLYPNDSARKSAREEQFKRCNTSKSGYITLGEWIQYGIDHITEKLHRFPKDCLSDNAGIVSRQEFIDFVKKAMVAGSSEHNEMYHFLLKTFQAGDVKRVGKVDHYAFDKMIEAAAAAPRRHGLAPKAEDMFKNDQDRIAQRKIHFDKMDADGNGTISFDEWVDFVMKHIMGKLATL